MINCHSISESLAALWTESVALGFLTVLGMTMGVTSVIAIVSTVEGMQNNIEDAFASLGSNTFIVTRFGLVSQCRSISNACIAAS